jgi:Na+-driven multidrug efflux pump
MAVSSHDIVMAAVGFILITIMTPIGMAIVVATNSTFGVSTATAASTWASVYTLFTVLLPVLYIVGAAIFFIPKIGK